MPGRVLRQCPVALLALGLCCAAGCRGSGRIDLTALDFRSIDPPAPRMTPVQMQGCYWWTDADGRVWIAMQRQQVWLFNPRFRFDFHLSLALEKLPAGRARNYSIGRESLRGRVRVGPWESRFTSRVGIVALYRESGNRLRGSLRIETSRTVARLLGGWSRPTRYLFLGSFVAVHDERRGRPIAEATESSGWEREIRRPTSGPAPTPATAPAGP